MSCCFIPLSLRGGFQVEEEGGKFGLAILAIVAVAPPLSHVQQVSFRYIF